MIECDDHEPSNEEGAGSIWKPPRRKTGLCRVNHGIPINDGQPRVPRERHSHPHASPINHRLGAANHG